MIMQPWIIQAGYKKINEKTLIITATIYYPCYEPFLECTGSGNGLLWASNSLVSLEFGDELTERKFTIHTNESTPEFPPDYELQTQMFDTIKPNGVKQVRWQLNILEPSNKKHRNRRPARNNGNEEYNKGDEETNAYESEQEGTYNGEKEQVNNVVYKFRIDAKGTVTRQVPATPINSTGLFYPAYSYSDVIGGDTVLEVTL